MQKARNSRSGLAAADGVRFRESGGTVAVFKVLEPPGPGELISRRRFGSGSLTPGRSITTSARYSSDSV